MTQRAFLHCIAAVALALGAAAFLETMGLSHWLLARLVLLPMLAIFAVIACARATLDLGRYFVGARRMPAAAGGAFLAVQVLAAFPAAWLVAPADGLPVLVLPVAILCGLALAALLPGGRLRASEALTLPEFLAARFAGLGVRVPAALVSAAVCLLLAGAAARAGAFIAAPLLGLEPQLALTLVCSAAAFIAICGGMRSLAAIQIPALAMLLTAGAAFMGWLFASARIPAARLVPEPAMSGAAGLIELAGAQPLSAIVYMAAGLASLPVLLGVFQAMERPRHAAATAAAGAGFAILVVAAASFSFRAQEETMAASDLPAFLSIALAAAALAPILSLCAMSLLAAANTLGHDIYHKALRPHAAHSARLAVCRLLLAVLAVAVALGAGTDTQDVFAPSTWALSVAAASLFPALVLTIAWKDATAAGIAAGMAAGAGVAFSCLAAARFAPAAGREDALLLRLAESPAAGAFGVAAGFAAAVAVSLLQRRLARQRKDGKELPVSGPARAPR